MSSPALLMPLEPPNRPPPGLSGVPGIELEVPLVSASLNLLKAALFKRPTGGPPPPPTLGVRGLEALEGKLDPFALVASSREPNAFHPA